MWELWVRVSYQGGSGQFSVAAAFGVRDGMGMEIATGTSSSRLLSCRGVSGDWEDCALLNRAE